ncbi:UDP-N-acetylglucosamine--dolichyl-phosphate N-acetylglucosaminephosphotransferase [Diutina catenulata]
MWLRLSLLVLSLCLITPNSPLRTAVAFGVIAYLVMTALVPRVGPSFVKIGLSGRDLNKRPNKDGSKPAPIPETMGLVAALTYLFAMFFLIPFVFFKYLVNFANVANDEEISKAYSDQYDSLENNHLFPHNKLATFLSSLLCLQSTTILGLCDDLFDIRWRHKFFLPAVAAIPLLIVYYVDFSVTSVVIPTFVTNNWLGKTLLWAANWVIWTGNHLVTSISGLSFRTLATDYEVPVGSPKLLDLGIFYYGYMAAIAIFAPNCINILAGVNGLEVGQSVVLGIVLLVNDLCYLLARPGTVSQAAIESHLFSAIFIIPFLGVSLGLLRFNWFPAQVFVGDTYCYFAGMVFAVVGISGHFSKTLLLFLLPQIVNFLYSVPQLFHIVPCPRHRMPKLNYATNKLEPSYGNLYGNDSIDVTPAPTPAPSSTNLQKLALPETDTLKTRVVVNFFLIPLEKLRLIRLERDPSSGRVVRFSNMTVINWILITVGPLREDHLCSAIMGSQLLMGLAMILVRHTLGPWVFGYDNLSWGVSDRV